ncbi:MAG: hypothetical protein P3B98_11660 [Gemmatimonadota bacterium]|nr:hypothetical protein [Gemmatimonadota bacterium]
MTSIQRPSRTTTRWVRLGARTAVVAAASLLLAARATAQLSVEDLELRFVSVPGGKAPAAQTFRINNTGDQPLQATISIADWDRAESGQNRYFTAGSQASSCTAHMGVFPMVLRLEPHSSEDVRVALKDGVGAACHSILFVETPPPPPSARGASITYRLRYGVKVYVEPNSPFAGEIVESGVVAASVAASPTAHAPRADSLEILYRNPGSRQSLTTGEIQIRRPDDSVAARIPVGEFPVLPGATRRLRLPLPTLATGRYVILALLEFGGDDVVATQVEWQVP